MDSKIIIGVILGIIGSFAIAVSIPNSDQSIPPTNAFNFLNYSGDSIMADSYRDTLFISPGTNILLGFFSSNDTLKISANTTNTITLEQLKNVTDSGCSSGQVRTVNSSGWWVCSTISVVGGNTTTSNDLGDFITTSPTYGHIFQFSSLANAFVNKLFNIPEKNCPAGQFINSLQNDTESGCGMPNVSSGNSTRLSELGDVSNNVNSTKGNILVANGTFYGPVKVGLDGQVLTVDSTKQHGVKWATQSTGKTETNSMGGGDARLLKSNSTSEDVFKSLTAGSNISITNGTDTITIAASFSGGATALGANVTGTLPGTDYLVWTVPLTANSGNTVTGTITATSTVSGTAVRAGANVTNLNTRGFCHWVSVATTTSDSIDNIVMNTISTGRVTNNGETLWIAAANEAQPISFECSVKTGPTAGNMKFYITPEVAGATISAKAGSYYIKTP